MFGSCFISCLLEGACRLCLCLPVFIDPERLCIPDFLIYQFARNIIRGGICNIILHAEIEYKRNHDLFYSLNVYKKRVVYHFVTHWKFTKLMLL
jgi:hypothetical protein